VKFNLAASSGRLVAVALAASWRRSPPADLRDIPIEATIGVRGRFTEVPRLPFQIGNCLVRAAKFMARLPHSLREQW
jgi:hypothetical protein